MNLFSSHQFYVCKDISRVEIKPYNELIDLFPTNKFYGCRIPVNVLQLIALVYWKQHERTSKKAGIIWASCYNNMNDVKAPYCIQRAIIKSILKIQYKSSVLIMQDVLPFQKINISMMIHVIHKSIIKKQKQQ